MNTIEINNTYNHIKELLEKKQLKEAFEVMTSFSDSLHIWSITDKINGLKENYRLMLNYLYNGTKDPERDKLYHSLIASSYKIIDQIKEELQIINSNDYVFSQKRYFPYTKTIDQNNIISDLEKQSLSQEENCKENATQRESLADQLFRIIWLSGYNAEEEIELIKKTIQSEQIRIADKSLIISALTLTLLRSFHKEKILLLIEYCNHENEDISQRALVGLLPILAHYDNRLIYFPAIRNRLVVLFDNNQILKRLMIIILQFARTNETEKISKKLKEEILPEMMKVAPKIKDKIDLEDLLKSDDSDEKNPEWQEILENSGIADKLKEFNDLQMEGSDVYMSTFAMLKNYPFFNAVSNWFKPFDATQSDICELFNNDGKTLLSGMMNNGYMCNSDRYSFCLSLAQMPSSQRATMSKAFSMEAEQMKEIQQEDDILNKLKRSEQISNAYIQDIYRFFNLFPQKKDFYDPFEHSLNYQNTWFFTLTGLNNEDIRELGEYYFSKDFYPSALEVFEKIEQEGTKTLDLYQKIGYCYQKIGDYENALKHYLQADIIAPNQKWTIRKVAYCYRLMKNYNLALEYYLKAEEMDPNNLTVLTQIGNCYLNLKNHNDALAYYFKIEYTSKNNVKIWRAIAWTSFLADKMEQSTKFLDKAMSKKEDWTDFFHLGHISFVNGDIKGAISNYEKAFVLGDKNLEYFIHTFLQDAEFLKEKGINDNDISLILDYIRFSVD